MKYILPLLLLTGACQAEPSPKPETPQVDCHNGSGDVALPEYWGDAPGWKWTYADDLKNGEIDGDLYGQFSNIVGCYPEMKPLVDGAMGDGKITWGEYGVLRNQFKIDLDNRWRAEQERQRRAAAARLKLELHP